MSVRLKCLFFHLGLTCLLIGCGASSDPTMPAKDELKAYLDAHPELRELEDPEIPEAEPVEVSPNPS